jgi:glycosyltransferase involved in cell wall biosynthesis
MVGRDRAYVNLPYFSDLSRFQGRRALPSSPDVTFLYSGSLSVRKGVDLLARAFARLARDRPTIRLKIMGQGPLETSMKASLRTCREQVEWVGFKEWHELHHEYATAQIMCVPSRYDGWGLVVPEALATGLPLIGTDRTGAALEMIEPGANGWLIPAGSEQRLFEALATAADLNQGKWQAMSDNASASVAEHTLDQGAMRLLAAADAAACLVATARA